MIARGYIVSIQIRKIGEVEQIVKLDKTSIYRMAKQGAFPLPIKLGERSSGWIESEIQEWLEDRIKASRNAEGV